MKAPSGFVSVRAAASRLSHLTRQRDFDSLGNREKQAVARELQALLIPSDVKIMIHSRRGVWLELKAADRVNGFRLSYVSETDKLGAKACRVNGGERDLIIRKSDFDALVSLPPPLIGDSLIDFAELQKLGFPFSKKTLERMEDDGRWKIKRASDPGKKAFWRRSEAVVEVNRIINKTKADVYLSGSD